MINKTSVSVCLIIPAYNCRNYIEECLLSVKNQTYKNIHIILIDDHSSDDTKEIIKNFIKHHSYLNITFIENQKNLGLSATRNIGIKFAKEDYIFFMDSDDIIPPYAIQSLVNFTFKYPKAEIIFGNHFKFSLTSKDFPYSKSNNRYKVIEGRNAITKYILKEPLPTQTSWNQLIKKDWLVSNKLYFVENIYNEDLCWNFFSINYLNQIVCSEIITYYYRYNDKGIMATISYYDFANNLEKIINIWLNHSNWINFTKVKYILKKFHTIYIYRFNKLNGNIYLGYLNTLLYIPIQLYRLITMKSNLVFEGDV